MASSSGTTAQSVKDIILSDPSTLEQWYDNIRGAVPENLLRYFDPESDDVYDELIAPVRPVNEPPPDQNEAPQNRKARVDRNNDTMEIFYKEFRIHEFERRKWAKYLDVEAELRDRIQVTGSSEKGKTAGNSHGSRLAHRPQSLDGAAVNKNQAEYSIRISQIDGLRSCRVAYRWPSQLAG